MNPYFVWEEHLPGARWRPFTDLLQPEVARERVGTAREALLAMFGLDPAVVPERVVASVTFLGVASRLIAPPMHTPRLPQPGELYWQEVPGGPWPMACTAGAASPYTSGRFREMILGGLVTPLLETFRDTFRLSPKVLWGNVASALAGAAGQLDTPDGWRLAGELLTAAPLAGAADLRGRVLRRRNCCLYYRIPGGGTCADCVLRPPR